MTDSIPACKLRMGMVGGDQGAFASTCLGAVRYIRAYAAQHRTPTDPAGQSSLHGSSQGNEHWMTLGAE